MKTYPRLIIFLLLITLIVHQTDGKPTDQALWTPRQDHVHTEASAARQGVCSEEDDGRRGAGLQEGRRNSRGGLDRIGIIWI